MRWINFACIRYYSFVGLELEPGGSGGGYITNPSTLKTLHREFIVIHRPYGWTYVLNLHFTCNRRTQGALSCPACSTTITLEGVAQLNPYWVWNLVVREAVADNLLFIPYVKATFFHKIPRRISISFPCTLSSSPHSSPSYGSKSEVQQTPTSHCFWSYPIFEVLSPAITARRFI